MGITTNGSAAPTIESHPQVAPYRVPLMEKVPHEILAIRLATARSRWLDRFRKQFDEVD